MDFNDWQNNWSPAKRAIKNLNNTIKRYYSNKNNIKIKDKNEEQRIEKMAWHEIIMPYDLYTSKVLEDVGLLMTQTSFKSRNMKKIDSNIEIINKMLFVDHKDVDYVAKWLRIPSKIFIRLMKKYKEWVDKKSEQQRSKTKMKIERLINIKGLIQVYMGLNRGKWINTNGILNFIKPWNL